MPTAKCAAAQPRSGRLGKPHQRGLQKAREEKRITCQPDFRPKMLQTDPITGKLAAGHVFQNGAYLCSQVWIYVI